MPDGAKTATIAVSTAMGSGRSLARFKVDGKQQRLSWRSYLLEPCRRLGPGQPTGWARGRRLGQRLGRRRARHDPLVRPPAAADHDLAVQRVGEQDPARSRCRPPTPKSGCPRTYRWVVDPAGIDAERPPARSVTGIAWKRLAQRLRSDQCQKNVHRPHRRPSGSRPRHLLPGHRQRRQCRARPVLAAVCLRFESRPRALRSSGGTPG